MRYSLLIGFLTLLRFAQAQPMDHEGMISLISGGKEDSVLAVLHMPASQVRIPSTQEEAFRLVVYVIAQCAIGDTLLAAQSMEKLLEARLSTVQAREVITFVFRSGSKFITQPNLYFFIQELGYQLAEKFNESRAQFSFLQQKFSLYQMTNQPGRVRDLLIEMRALSVQRPYLAFLNDMHHGLFYSGLQHDSCVYYFERYLSQAPEWIGKENTYFLNDPVFAAKKDSSIMASSVMEYAKHYVRKGDLKKAGELLITSVRLIPDTSSFAILKIQNQLILSTIYTDLVNPSRALQYAREAISISEKYELKRLRNTQIAATYAYALMGAGAFEEAARELETAYRAFSRGVNCQDPRRQALRLALNAAYMGDIERSGSWADTAALMRCESNPETRYLETMVQGSIAMHQGKHTTAFRLFSEAEDVARKAHALGWRKEAMHWQYVSAREANHTVEGLRALEAYAHLNDSLYRSGQEVALYDIEAGYHKSIQDETIARLDAENTTSAERIAAQRRNLLVILGGLALVTALLLLVLRLYRQVKASNAIITRAIEEKNILLREIHHRVKNNLQVISSLLKLQSSYIHDEAAVQAIAEGRSRVQSMALLHQNLYKEDNLTGVNMQEYFDNLIQGLFDTYNITPDRISLHKKISPINLDVDTVVPLGLITNELISNALKHAFPENGTGNLYVDLYEENENLVLRIRDDGVGRASGAAQGFGSKLIQSLSQKLEAELTTRSQGGTEVVLTMKDYSKAA